MFEGLMYERKFPIKGNCLGPGMASKGLASALSTWLSSAAVVVVLAVVVVASVVHFRHEDSTCVIGGRQIMREALVTLTAFAGRPI